METIISKPASPKMTEAIRQYAELKKKEKAAREKLNKEALRLLPYQKALDETEEQIADIRKRLQKFVTDRKTRRYNSAYGQVDYVEGRPQVVDWDFAKLDAMFIKQEPKKQDILKFYRTHDNTAPEGAVVKQGEPSIKITV